MTDTWLLLNSGAAAAAFNMGLDEALLASAPRLAFPVLRFYGWTQPAASFGYFQKFADIERATHLRPLVRRPTGGGLVPHDTDWTYSVTIPAGHPWHALEAQQSYRAMHEWVRAAFARLGVDTTLAGCCHRARPGECFAGYERDDVLWQGRKIAGAAQRRTRTGLLIQGSVQPPPPGPQRQPWQEAVREVRPGSWHDLVPDARLLECAAQLAQGKYERDDHQRRR